MTTSRLRDVPRTNPEMRLVDYLKTGMARRGEPVPEADPLIARAALSSVAALTDLTNIVTVSILEGFREAPSSIEGWVSYVALPDYATGYLARLDTLPRVENQPRGGTASHAVLGFADLEGVRLGRYSAQIRLDEQGILDAGPLGLFQRELTELGRAAKRLPADLVYSLLLENKNMADGYPLFGSDHSNTGTGAFGSVTFAGGVSAIASQVALDTTGRPVHLNQEPKFIVVPPAMYQSVLTTLDDSILQRLEVRIDSRLSTTGVLDPRDGSTLRLGTNTNWLLACEAERSPGIVLGTLAGATEPVVRPFELDQGQWGRGFDIRLDLAVACGDYRPLFWGTGV